MFLIHTTDENKINDILNDGYLKSSNKTKNVRMYGHPEGSKYIYLRLGKRDDYANLYLDYRLLLENTFYLQVGWQAVPTTEKIDGKKLTENQLLEVLKKFNNKINYYKQKKIKEKYNLPVSMYNEILIEKNVNLKKYLKKVNISKYNKKIESTINEKYPEVKLNY